VELALRFQLAFFLLLATVDSHMLDILQLFQKVCHVVGHGAAPCEREPQRTGLREDLDVS
jgi:hypothetical protein